MSAITVDPPDWKAPLGEAFDRALMYLEGLPDRPVRSTASLAELRATLGGPLPEEPAESREVIAALAAAAEPGVVPSSSGRFFGFVVGGATPAAVAADWLTSVWDQNAGLYVLGPAASVVEEVAGAWLAELLGLPRQVSVGFVTGAQLANTTGLAAARYEMLRRVGWDTEVAGLCGAPRLQVIAGQGRHAAVAWPWHRLDRRGRDGCSGSDAAGSAAACLGARRWTGHRVHPGGQREHRSSRSGR
jgi:hypothetical protein